MTIPIPHAFPELSCQDSNTMLEISQNWNLNIHHSRQKVLAIYDKMHRQVVPLLTPAVANVAYGKDPKQTLDVYVPIAQSDSTTSPRPVIIFIHGGGFIRGKKDSTSYIYANIPRFFAQANYVAINIGYRLAPQACYPEAAKDIASAITWIRSNIGALGGDIRNMVIFGHSAGGAHVAHFLGHPMFAPENQWVKAAIIASGRLDNDTFANNPNAEGVCAYYGSNPTLQTEHSPLAFAQNIKIPLMVAFAQYENPYLDFYSLLYAAEVAKNGNIPRVIQLMHHNHTSIVAHLGIHKGLFEQELLNFIYSHTQ